MFVVETSVIILVSFKIFIKCFNISIELFHLVENKVAIPLQSRMHINFIEIFQHHQFQYLFNTVPFHKNSLRLMDDESTEIGMDS